MYLVEEIAIFFLFGNPTPKKSRKKGKITIISMRYMLEVCDIYRFY